MLTWLHIERCVIKLGLHLIITVGAVGSDPPVHVASNVNKPCIVLGIHSNLLNTTVVINRLVRDICVCVINEPGEHRCPQCSINKSLLYYL